LSVITDKYDNDDDDDDDDKTKTKNSAIADKPRDAFTYSAFEKHRDLETGVRGH